jgi:hypothetical protein
MLHSIWNMSWTSLCHQILPMPEQKTFCGGQDIDMNPEGAGPVAPLGWSTDRSGGPGPHHVPRAHSSINTLDTQACMKGPVPSWHVSLQVTHLHLPLALVPSKVEGVYKAPPTGPRGN